ncbi:interferon-induced protein 44-like [Mercenaria mercenaria]|uniref:interferon-induced protein 44-like n=1 Tax=Mercenaria mercenaria TaxID=6596 RepID=UPI00234E8CB7|nr:interferon-induced protein 44-like [Mercenaria mercenaria]
MKSPWRKQEQNETGTKELYRRKSGKKPPTQDQNAAGDTRNNRTCLFLDRPPGNPATDAVGATGENKSGLMKTQWRKLEQNEKWTKQYAGKLLSDIQKACVNDKNISNIRILLLGSVGAGKSSFLNTVASIDRGRISQITIAGGADGSLTFALKEYWPQYKLKNFRILDTMGVEDNVQGGLNLNDVLYLVKGHIPPDYKFNPATQIDERSPEFRPEPKDNEKIHCVVFVLDATVAGNDNISDARRRKIKELQTALKAINIPRIVLLTKIDVLCEFVDADIENTYKSEKVKEAVNVAKELYKLPENCVFFR